MTLDRTLGQLLILRSRSAGPKVVARSTDVSFDQEEAALRLAVRFGPRPDGTPCPGAVFAAPCADRVAVVQVADRPDGGDDPPLAFRFLLFQPAVYRLLGDPFAIARRYPPPWDARDSLPALEWPAEPLPSRTVGPLSELLTSHEAAVLLGSTQALLYGAKVLLDAKTCSPDIVEAVWQFLPDRLRCDVWPASFAFDAGLNAHLSVVPGGGPSTFLSAEQASDYPLGRYEEAIELAVKAGDQAELDRLLARKSSAEVLHLAITVLVFALFFGAVMKWF